MDELYINCSVCGECVKIKNHTGRFLLVKPCAKCIDFEVARAVKITVDKYFWIALKERKKRNDKFKSTCKNRFNGKGTF